MSGAETTALGVVNVTAGSDVGRLGEAAKEAEAALATAKPEASRDTSADDAAKAAADKVAADKAAADKAAEDAAKATALTAAEKAVADAKTPEEKAAAEKALADLKGEKKADGAPEKYEDFKLPEGVKLDAVALETALPVFKELNLSQEQAQKLVDMEAARVTARATADLDRWNKHMSDTLAAAKADKEIGGANWDQSVADAKVAIEKFGTPALQTYLSAADAGSHPEIVRLLAKVGKAAKEDGFVPGAAKTGDAPKSLAHRIFPNDK